MLSASVSWVGEEAALTIILRHAGLIGSVSLPVLDKQSAGASGKGVPAISVFGLSQYLVANPQIAGKNLESSQSGQFRNS